MLQLKNSPVSGLRGGADRLFGKSGRDIKKRCSGATPCNSSTGVQRVSAPHRGAFRIRKLSSKTTSTSNVSGLRSISSCNRRSVDTVTS